MTQDRRDLLHRIYSRLCFHCAVVPERYAPQRMKFIETLLPYPEDLICAAYHHLIRHRCVMPTHQDFIDFMEPEFTRRQKEALQEEYV